MKNLVIASFLVLTSCSIDGGRPNNNNLKDSSNQIDSIRLHKNSDLVKKESVNLKVFKQIHTLKKKNGIIIGNIYVKYINNDIFSSLLIIKDSSDKKDTLYIVETNKFLNSKGLDITVSNDDLKGYKLVMMKDDYITLTCIDQKNKESSDYITIEWNYDNNILEVQKAP